MRYGRTKPLIKYRFKDRMGCVFFKTFHNDHEARIWFEQHKAGYALMEFGSLGITYKTRFVASGLTVPGNFTSHSIYI